MCLQLFKKIFYVTAKLSDVIQAEELEFAAAATFIEETIDTLKSFRTEDEWRKVYDEATALVVSLDVSVTSPRSRRAYSIPETF